MEEYNINNIHKINSINFINITEDKLSKSKRPQYKVNQLENFKSKNIVEKTTPITKGKGQQYSQRNALKNPLNSRLLNTTGNDDNELNYQDMNNIYIDINQKNMPLPIPITSISMLKPKIKTANNRTASKKIKTNNYVNRKIIEPISNNYNNNTYNNGYNNNNYNNNTNNYNNNNNINKYNNNMNNFSNYNNYSEIMVNNNNNNNMIYEKQINELKRQNRGLLNKLSFYLNDIQSKNKTINNLQQQKQNLQSELNTKYIYDNSNEHNLNDIVYNSKRLHQNSNNNIISN